MLSVLQGALHREKNLWTLSHVIVNTFQTEIHLIKTAKEIQYLDRVAKPGCHVSEDMRLKLELQDMAA